MNGKVDESLRALLRVLVSPNSGETKTPLCVWIDTAFNGGLVIPLGDIQTLGLRKASSIEAILADGQLVELPTYTCYLDWFGEEYSIQVVAKEGNLPLLGTQLLDHRKLNVDYELKTLSLE